MNCRTRLQWKSTGAPRFARRKRSYKTARALCGNTRNNETNRFMSLRGYASIGAEYGEGFEMLDSTRNLHQVDVAALNKRLKVTGAQRLRHAMKPDEALGAIFMLDGVLVNTTSLRMKSWEILAEEHSHKLPLVWGPHMLDLIPEKLIMEVLKWSTDVAIARRLSHRLCQIYASLFIELQVAEDGVMNWLNALDNTNVPCAVISEMSRKDVVQVLTNLELLQFFSTAIVTFENDMETTAQKFLCAAMKMGRPPEQCVVFDSSPMGIAAAHNCTMKAVAIQGQHKGYQLKQADLTCASLDELTVYNLRRLFANKGAEFMDHDKAKDKKDQIKRSNYITTY